MSLRANQMKMLIWAKACPENFQHKYDLVAAEMMKTKGASGRRRNSIIKRSKAPGKMDTGRKRPLPANVWRFCILITAAGMKRDFSCRKHIKATWAGALLESQIWRKKYPPLGVHGTAMHTKPAHAERSFRIDDHPRRNRNHQQHKNA